MNFKTVIDWNAVSEKEQDSLLMRPAVASYLFSLPVGAAVVVGTTGHTAEEKDMILIVATEAQRRPIMQALINQAHEHPEYGTVTFSLPVSDTMGLRLDRRFTNNA